MGEEKESFNQEDVDLALARVAAGEKKAAVVRTSPVPLRTLFQLVKRAADGGSTVPSRPGPKPVLPAELERDLAEWIAAMQRATPSSATGLRSVLRACATVDEDGHAVLHLGELFIELKIDAARIINMDETSFMPKTARRKVVARLSQRLAQGDEAAST
ncbi:uncharacterized protein IUM83_10873 [Phytophthora cinnamomi]|uniref:uncharacterized protein n=1 Tax=Phytophthora cinnamomi TaxID=4785 RepID=UPI0035598FCB|nr:hypothetical protein IUM83_10873 [Phytophthora cinnamomi]